MQSTAVLGSAVHAAYCSHAVIGSFHHQAFVGWQFEAAKFVKRPIMIVNAACLSIVDLQLAACSEPASVCTWLGQGPSQASM